MTTPQEDQAGVSNRFQGTLLHSFPVPLPANYLLGIDAQKIDHETHNRPSYLHGIHRPRGWWYYYVYAALVKVPVGIWLLGGVVITSRWWHRDQRWIKWRDELVLLAPTSLVLLVVSSQTRFTDHFRYVLPVFPFLFIWVGQAANVAVAGHRYVRVTVAFLASWLVASCLFVFPHTLSCFNEFAGGPGHGAAHLLGSNLDWGQDLLYLKRWRDQHPEAEPLYVAYWGAIDPRAVGIEYQIPPPVPTVGWHAVSLNILKGCPWRIQMGDRTTDNVLGHR